jgi:gliding motility-associated-like protein
VVTADAGVCESEVTVSAPILMTDNCSATTVINDYSNTADASGLYATGITVVNWILTDASGNTAECSMTVTVLAPPVAEDDVVTTQQNTPISIDILANDSDCNNNIDPSSVTVISDPENGTYTVNSETGTVEFSPDENFSGTDVFTYSVCNADGLCDTANVTVTVTNDNNPPVAENDVLTITDCSSVTIEVLQNDSDPDGDELTAPVIITDVTSGELTVNEDGTFDYLPELGFEGDVTFTYEICDIPESGEPLCDQAEVTISVIQPDQQLSCFIEVVLPVSEAGNDAEAEVIVSGGWGDYTYEWSDGQTTAVATGLSPGDYFVIVTDAEGCATGCEITIEEYDEGEPGDDDQQQACEFFIPEGFSPNDDGINDYFIIECMEQYPNATIEVYTRWGVMVYEKENYGNTDLMGSTEAWWDGRSDNKMTVGKEKLPPGTYFYILHLNDGSDPITGSVFLNR